MRFFIWLLLFLIEILSIGVNCKPSSVLVLYDTSQYQDQNETIIYRSKRGTQNNAKITSMRVKSDVSLHYAITLITTKVINPHATSNEAEFSFILPETAYISKFTMEIDGKEYIARIEEKEAAKRIYNTAVASGQAAAHLKTRDSNHFIVSVNLEPTKKATFKLRYEELLMRKYGLYNLIINLNPGQVLDEMTVDVNIQDVNPIYPLYLPEFKSGNEVQDFNVRTSNPFATIRYYKNNHGAKIHFAPNRSQQQQIIKAFQEKVRSPNFNVNDGISGQFVVQYDVQLDAQGQIFSNNSYFLHILAPKNLQIVSKYVVFVLDISGSMSGTKIRQLREAMLHIMDDLKPMDLFSIVKFGHKVEVPIIDHRNPNKPTVVNSVTISQAKNTIRSLDANGWATNMELGLKTGFNLINDFKKTQHTSNKNSPIMVFLSDGEINAGARGDQLLAIAKGINTYKAPIYTLGFGSGSDRYFLDKLALKNDGFMKKIYDGEDGSEQLKVFYREISSPLLIDIDYMYPQEMIENNCITNTKFSRYYNGSEMIVAGKMKKGRKINSQFRFKGKSENILQEFTPKQIEVNNEYELPLERLWAYLSIKQLIDDITRGVSNEASTRQRALDLALKYSFVTPITSLVVVKPKESAVVNPVPIRADASGSFTLGRRFGGDDSTDDNDNQPALENTADETLQPLISEIFNNWTDNNDNQTGTSETLVTEISNDNQTNSYDIDLIDEIFGAYLPTDSSTPPSNLSIFDLENYSWVEQYISNTENVMNIPLNEDGQLTTLKLKPKLDTLGLNFTSEACSNAIGGGAGTCMYLTSCENLSEGLADLVTYRKFYCINQMYAGVCCKE